MPIVTSNLIQPRRHAVSRTRDLLLNKGAGLIIIILLAQLLTFNL